MKSHLLLIPTLAILLATSIISCTSKDESAIEKEGLLGGPVLNKMPSKPLFFMVNNSSTKAFKKLKDSPQYSAGLRLTKTFEDALKEDPSNSPADQGKKNARTMVKALKDSGLIPTSEKDSGLFQETVVFADNSEGQINLAAYASPEKGKDLKEAL